MDIFGLGLCSSDNRNGWDPNALEIFGARSIDKGDAKN